MGVKAERDEALKSLVCRATIEAIDSDEAVYIGSCLEGCQNPKAWPCQMCDTTLCLPNGTVSRETRGN